MITKLARLAAVVGLGVSFNSAAQLGLGPLDDVVNTATAAIATPVEGVLPTGFYQSFNARWAADPSAGLLALPVLKYDVDDRAHDSSKNYVSVSYFPRSNIQLNQLDVAQFEMFVPKGSSCPANSVRAEILLNDNEIGSPRVRAILKPGRRCTAGKWNLVELHRWQNVDWGASSSSGPNEAFDAKWQAHQWAKAQAGGDYRIWGIRFQFLGDKNFGPTAYFKNLTVNGSTLYHPLIDVGFYGALDPANTDLLALVGINAGALLSAPESNFAWFQSRNVKWQAGEGGLPLLNEAMRYFPAGKSEPDQPFMSVSAFLQDKPQLTDIKVLSADFLPISGRCEELAPFYVNFEVFDASGQEERNVFVDYVGECGRGVGKRGMNFLNDDPSLFQWRNWGGIDVVAVPGKSTRFAHHEALQEALGDDYYVETIRFGYDDKTSEDEFWIDNLRIDDNVLDSRFKDWSPAAQAP